MKKRMILCAAALAACVAGSAREISVRRFGAIPDDGRNDAPALRKAAAYCRTHPGTTLVFPAGTYELSDPVAADIERRAISGALGRGIEVQWQLFQPQKPFVTGLDFTGCRDLTIEAVGARLRVEGWMQVLSFVGCRGLCVHGLEITYRRPAATEGRIVRSTETDFDVEYDPELYTYIDSIVQGRTYYYSAERRHFYYGWEQSMELVRPGLVRVQSRVHPPVGDTFIIRYGGHYRPCVMVRESEDVVLRGLAIRSFPGMGIVGHLSRNILVDSLTILPEEGRYSSTSTDATHFTSCSGELTIQNSLFAGNGDDCTNVHNYYYKVYPSPADAAEAEIRIEGADLHAQSLDYPEEGDTMVVLDGRTMQEQARYVVQGRTVDAGAWRVDIRLDRALEGHDFGRCLMYNHTRFPRVHILNNTTLYNNGRAFLLKAPWVEVCGNSIARSTLSAIKLGAELSWKEAGAVEHALVRDNVLDHTGTDSGYRATAVMLTTEAPETPPHVNRDILIERNRVTSPQPVAILLWDAEGVTVRDNVFIGGHDILQRNSQHVSIGSNIYK